MTVWERTLSQRGPSIARVAALTPHQARFVAEYPKDLNATAAAERAGYSKASAPSQGSRLLKNRKVAKAIDEALQRRAERVEVKSDDVLRVLLRMLNADIGKAYGTNGKLLPVHELPEEIRLIVSSIETDEWPTLDAGEDREGKPLPPGRTVKLKFWSKEKALELAMRHLGMLKDKVEHSLEQATLEQLVAASYKPGGS